MTSTFYRHAPFTLACSMCLLSACQERSSSETREATELTKSLADSTTAKSGAPPTPAVVAEPAAASHRAEPAVGKEALVAVDKEATARPLNEDEQRVTRLQLRAGMTPFFEQSFRVDFQEIDEAGFVAASSEDGRTLEILITTQGKLYQNLELPESTNSWTLDSVAAVAFRDINGDHLTDIAVLADYMTGIGPEGATPFSQAFIYLRSGSTFKLDPKRSERAERAGKNIKKALSLAAD